MVTIGLMKAQAIKIALPGEDARTKPDSPANIAKFSLLGGISEFSLLKVKSNAKINLTNGSTETIPHGLDYTPIVWVFINRSGDLYPIYDDIDNSYMYVDATNLIIHNGDGTTNDFYYYIFYDQV